MSKHKDETTTKPRWVQIARQMGIPAYPSNAGWVLDLDEKPAASARYLAKHGTHVASEILYPENFELVRLAHDLRVELVAAGVDLPPILERMDPGLPSQEQMYQDVQSCLVAGLEEATRARGYEISSAALRQGVATVTGNGPGRAEAANGLYLSTIFFAPDGNRQYIFFSGAGPWILFDVRQDCGAVTGAGFDETDVEMIELGIEIISLLVSILGLAIGVGALAKAEAAASRAAFREFLKKLLGNPRLRALLVAVIAGLSGVDIERLRRGDKEVISDVLRKFLDLIKAIWDEGLIRELLALLGVEAALIAAVMFVLWWFGIGEILSFILVALGIGMLVADLTAFIAKLVDWQKRKQSKPSVPSTTPGTPPR